MGDFLLKPAEIFVDSKPMEDALAIEDANSPYVNIGAVKEGHKNDPAIVALVAALQSETAREFINSTYKGTVVPAY